MPKKGKGPHPQPRQEAIAMAKAAAQHPHSDPGQPAVRRLGSPEPNKLWHAELPQFNGGGDKPG